MNVQNLLRAALLACLAAVAACDSEGQSTYEGPRGSVTPPPEGEPPPGTSARTVTLTTSASASPTVASVGQPLVVQLEVKNTGQGHASDVGPSLPSLSGPGEAVLSTPPSPAFVDLEPGQSHTFTFEYEAVASGPITFTFRADGVDTATTWPVSSTQLAAGLVIQSPAALAIDALRVPPTVNVGSTFEVAMTVTNGGQAAAMAVAPTALVPYGSAAVALMSGSPQAADIPGGSAATFRWTYQAMSAGSLVLAGSATGQDGNAGDMEVSAAEAVSAELSVDAPAQLSASLFIPAALSSGQTFDATLVVVNAGTSTARGVLPSNPVVVNATGTATAALLSSPEAADIPGGATASFVFGYRANGAGNFALRTAASGVDANDGRVVSAPAATSGAAAVSAPGALAITAVTAPASVNRGQGFSVAVAVKNTGGTQLSGVGLVSSPQVASAGGAAATTTSAPAAVALAPGQSATFNYAFTESGTAAGSLTFTATARAVDSFTGGTVFSSAAQSGLVVVRAPPVLLVESVVLPARISRGQTFEGTVVVRNTGGGTADGVLPAPNPMTLVVTGAAAATLTTAPVPASIPGGGTATFRYQFRESGTGAGTLQLRASASGSDAATGSALTSPAVSSTAMAVQTPARLAVTAVTAPANVSPGAPFTVSITVANTGQASALNVKPSPVPPTLTTTGAASASTTSAAQAVTLAGGASQTFTFQYVENGSGAGTLSFAAGAVGQEANSGASLAASAVSSVSTSVASAAGCNGSVLYVGFGSKGLTADRLDLPVNSDRLLVKPYAVLAADFQRVLGATPPAIQNQGATFSTPDPRWHTPQIVSVATLYTTYKAAFEGCLTLTATATQYGTAPNTTNAPTNCRAFATRFWNRTATTAEVTACQNFAINSTTAETGVRRRWAYTCAAMLTSVGFLSH